MTSEQKKILLTGLAMGLFLKGSWHRIDPNKVDNEWPVEFSWPGIRENPAFRASITTNPFYKISDLTVTAAELKALAITAEGSELTLTASSEKEGYSMGMFYNATEDTTITILCITELDTANASGGFNAPATGLYVRYTADPDGAKYSVAKVESALYLYGHPDEGGNVAVRSGDAVTVYDGAVLPDIYSVYTPELQVQYPYATIAYNFWGTLTRLVISTKPFEKKTGSTWEYAINSAVSVKVADMHTDTDEAWGELNPYDVDSYNMNGITWTNYELSKHDGTVMTCPDPIPVYKGVTAYLYNGVELPELPEIPSGYFACVLPLDVWLQYYSLYIASGITYYTDDSGDWNFRINGPAQRYLYQPYDTAWEKNSDVEDGHSILNIGSIDFPMWVNTELLNEDGTVGRTATDPIPVYE